MKITWRAVPGDTTTSPVVLGDDSIAAGPGRKKITTRRPAFRRLIQTAHYARATAVEQFDRSNIQSTYVFGVAYEFETVDQCSRWLTRLGNLLHGKGALALAYDDGGADTLIATWDALETLSQAGLAADVQFTFTGGAWTIVTAPATA